MKPALRCVLASLVLAAWAAASAAPAQLKAGVFEPPQAAPALSLQGSDGSELKLDRFRGKVIALVFGFTHCPEVCPTTLATLAQARKALGPQAERVQVVYVTVDPERDDVQGIKRYLAAFDPSFIGATGSAQALAAVRGRYGVKAEKVALPGGGYAFNHTSSVYLVDPAGRLRAMMPYGHGPKDFAHDFQLLLAAQ
jgi:protein SCO1/2